MGNPRVHIGGNFERGYMVDIGGMGFSFSRNGRGRYRRKPSRKGVVIGPDVFINSFCTVHEGTEHPTLIGRNSILDSYVHISHDVRVGTSVQLGSRVTLLGHVEVGDYSKVFAGSVVNPRVKIGENCIVGACSYVRHDVPDGAVVYGNPARVVTGIRYPHRRFG